MNESSNERAKRIAHHELHNGYLAGAPFVHPQCRCVLVPLPNEPALPGIDVIEQAELVVAEYESRAAR